MRTSVLLLSAFVSPLGYAAAASSDSALTAAARELDALRASEQTRGVDAQRQGLPRVSVPTLTLPASPDAAPPPVQLNETELKRRERQERKAANWLIEGVRQEEAAARRRERSRANGTPGSADLQRAEGADEAEPTEEPETERQSTVEERATSPTPASESKPTDPPNPFASFLADWLSPQDFQRFQRQNAETTRGGVGGTVGSTQAVPGVAPSQLAPTDHWFGGTGPAATSITPAQNPFLTALSLPSPPASETTAVIPPALSIGPAASITPSPPAEAVDQRPALPEFVKPVNDEKYFKPLKRF